MSGSRTIRCVALFVGLSLACVALAEQEAAVASKSSLPAAVEAAVKKAFPNAAVTKVEAEVKHGVRVFGIDLQNGKAEASIDVAEDGTVIAVETPIEAKDLPKAAADAIAKAAPGAIKEILKEEVQAKIKLVKLSDARIVYEVDVTKDGTKGELDVAADGTVVEPLKWKDHEAAEAKESKDSKEEGKDSEGEDKGHKDEGKAMGESKESKKEGPKELLNLSELVTVAQVLQKQFPQATLGAVKAVHEEGMSLYEVKFTDGQTKREATVARDGTVVMIETVIADKDLPRPVAEAIVKAALGATLAKIEKGEIWAAPKAVTLETPKVIYEAKVEGQGEVKVAADGTVLKAPKGGLEPARTKQSKVELPDAAAKAFKNAFPKGEIEKMDVDQENGVTVYDLEFKNGSAEQEMDIIADGTILEVTLVVDAKDVPEAAMKAIEKAAEGAKITRIENIEIRYETKDGKVVKLAAPVTHFAAEYAKGHKTAEVVVTSDGTLTKE